MDSAIARDITLLVILAVCIWLRARKNRARDGGPNDNRVAAAIAWLFYIFGRGSQWPSRVIQRMVKQPVVRHPNFLALTACFLCLIIVRAVAPVEHCTIIDTREFDNQDDVHFALSKGIEDLIDGDTDYREALAFFNIAIERSHRNDPRHKIAQDNAACLSDALNSSQLSATAHGGTDALSLFGRVYDLVYRQLFSSAFAQSAETGTGYDRSSRPVLNGSRLPADSWLQISTNVIVSWRLRPVCTRVPSALDHDSCHRLSISFDKVLDRYSESRVIVRLFDLDALRDDWPHAQKMNLIVHIKESFEFDVQLPKATIYCYEISHQIADSGGIEDYKTNAEGIGAVIGDAREPPKYSLEFVTPDPFARIQLRNSELPGFSWISTGLDSECAERLEEQKEQ